MANHTLTQLERNAARINKGELMKEIAFKKFKYFIILSGICLSIFTELKGGKPSIWYFLWAMFPYIVYYLATFTTKSMGAILAGGILILGVDIIVHIEIFYFPGSSTDSIALLTMPFWQSLIIMPAGFLFGWLIEKVVRKNIKGDRLIK